MNLIHASRTCRNLWQSTLSLVKIAIGKIMGRGRNWSMYDYVPSTATLRSSIKDIFFTLYLPSTVRMPTPVSAHIGAEEILKA